VCHDSTAALIVACSFCVRSAILSALIRSPYSRGSTTAATATAARTKTRTGRRLCQQRLLQGRRNRQRQPQQQPRATVAKCALWRHVLAWQWCHADTEHVDSIQETTQWWQRKLLEIDLSVNLTINHYFIVRPIVVQRAGQLSLPHVGISKTETNRNIKPMSSSYNTRWIKHKLVVSIYSKTETSLAMSTLAVWCRVVQSRDVRSRVFSSPVADAYFTDGIHRSWIMTSGNQAGILFSFNCGPVARRYSKLLNFATACFRRPQIVLKSVLRVKKVSKMAAIQ